MKYDISSEEYKNYCDVAARRTVNEIERGISVIVANFKGEEPKERVQKEFFPFETAKLSEYLLSENPSKEEIGGKLFAYFRSVRNSENYESIEGNVDKKYSREMYEITEKAVKELEGMVLTK